jgi:hypothetical protein
MIFYYSFSFFFEADFAGPVGSISSFYTFEDIYDDNFKAFIAPEIRKGELVFFFFFYYLSSDVLLINQIYILLECCWPIY